MGGKVTKKKNPVRRLTTYMRGRLSLVFLCIVCLFFILVARLAYWTIKNGDEFETIVLGQQNHASRTIAYERGRIYDRNGNVLASNEKIYTLVLEPKNIIDVGKRQMDDEDTVNPVVEATIRALNKYFGYDEDDLRQTIAENSNSYYVVYEKDLTYDQVAAFRDFTAKAELSWDETTPAAEKAEIKEARNVEGVVFEENYKRVYPYKDLACQLLGFTSSGNSGNWGIEQYYNDTLNGTNGRSYYYFNQELTQEQSVKEAENGHSVVTTIDMQIQQVIEEKLKEFDENTGSKMTSILVMDPQNGDVLGMASSNPYDLNDPMNEENLRMLYSEEEIQDMKEYTAEVEEKEKEQKGLPSDGEETEEDAPEDDTADGAAADDPNDSADEDTENAEEAEEDVSEENRRTIYDGFYQLWRNPIITDTHEPGSTYKPFTVATGLETGVLTGNESYYCTGSLPVGSWNIGCSHVHGNINLQNAVAESCNVAMMNIAFNEGNDIFYQYQNLFGFGRKTGIDLPGEAEASSLIPAEENRDTVTLATNAFGQNFNCTMIQLASGFASLINGGYYYEPQVVREIVNDDGNVVEEKETNLLRETVSEETSATMRTYLKETVENGTGTKAQIPGYSIGGKTGTAEKIDENGRRNKQDYYISFIGFVPAEDPEVLIYVTIDEPNVDYQANAGIAVELEKACMEEIVKILGIEPTEELTEEEKEELARLKEEEEAEKAAREASEEAAAQEETPEEEEGQEETPEEETGQEETSEEEEGQEETSEEETDREDSSGDERISGDTEEEKEEG